MSEDDEKLLRRIYFIHWRLRLRSPAGDGEKNEWAEIKGLLRGRFEGSFPEELRRGNDGLSNDDTPK